MVLCSGGSIFVVMISHCVGFHVMFALVICRCISRAMALLYSLMHMGEFTFCRESLVVIVSLCVFAKCLARLVGLLLVFVQFPT